jgi:hypothetical protein
MPVITEGLNLGDLLKYEAPNLYSRDQVTVAAGQNLVLGTVDGTEVAVGVLATSVDATLIDREDGILIARHAVVADQALTWPAGITPLDKAAAIAQLKAAGVLVRHAV